MAFAPGEPDGRGSLRATTLPAGRYALAMKFFNLKKSEKNGAPYIRGKFEVLMGPHKGMSTWMGLSMNVDNPKVANFLNMVCKAMALTPDDAFEPDQGAEIKRSLCFKPFQAELTKTKRGNYENNDFGKFIWPEEWSPQFRDATQEWRNEMLTEDEGSDWDGAPAGGDDWSGGGYGDAPPPGDDDSIPF